MTKPKNNSLKISEKKKRPLRMKKEEGTKNEQYAAGKYLVPLTIETLRQRYRVPGKDVYGKIHHIAPQSDADRLKIIKVDKKMKKHREIITLTVVEEFDTPQEYPPETITEQLSYFIPNGDLIEKTPKEIYGGGSGIVHKKWLQGDKPGPYEKGQEDPFYYLDGRAKPSWEKNEQEWSMQVSAGPLNVLSYNALDSIILWILE